MVGGPGGLPQRGLGPPLALLVVACLVVGGGLVCLVPNVLQLLAVIAGRWEEP